MIVSIDDMDKFEEKKNKEDGNVCKKHSVRLVRYSLAHKNRRVRITRYKKENLFLRRTRKSQTTAPNIINITSNIKVTL